MEDTVIQGQNQIDLGWLSGRAFASRDSNHKTKILNKKKKVQD